MRYSMIAVGMALSLLCFTRPVHAQDRFVTGSLSLETPVGMSPGRSQDNSPMVLGSLKLHNFLPHVNVFTSGQLQWKAGFPYSKENKALVGMEYEFSHGFSIYGFAERRFLGNNDRFVAGCRYSFKSPSF